MSQRAPFTSTIARALSSISQRTQSPSLKEKFEELFRLPASSIISPADASPITFPRHQAPDIRTVAEFRLWRLIQQRLYEPSAALSLKALKLAEDGEDSSTSMNSESDAHHDDNGHNSDEVLGVAEGRAQMESLSTPPLSQFTSHPVGGQRPGALSPMEMEEFLDELEGSNSGADSEMSSMLDLWSQTEDLTEEMQEDVFSTQKETDIEIPSSPPRPEIDRMVTDIATGGPVQSHRPTSAAPESSRRRSSEESSTVSSLDEPNPLSREHSQPAPSLKSARQCNTLHPGYDIEKMVSEEDDIESDSLSELHDTLERDISDLEEEREESEHDPLQSSDDIRPHWNSHSESLHGFRNDGSDLLSLRPPTRNSRLESGVPEDEWEWSELEES